LETGNLFHALFAVTFKTVVILTLNKRSRILLLDSRSSINCIHHRSAKPLQKSEAAAKAATKSKIMSSHFFYIQMTILANAGNAK
jgi:hypothetical protein